jgi:hypothetical protein
MRNLRLSLAVAVFAALATSFASAGENTDGDHGKAEARTRNPLGLIATLLEHADALTLTAGQASELRSIQAMREKLEADPQIRELFAQLREASTAMEDEKIGPLVDKITARKVELGAAKDPKNPLDILSEDQRKKWNMIAQSIPQKPDAVKGNPPKPNVTSKDQ